MKKLTLIGLLGLATAMGASAQDSSSVLPKWRFNADAGYSIRIAGASKGASATEKNYINDMRSGYNINVEGAYIFNRDWSIGAKYNTYTSAKTVLPIADENNVSMGSLNTNVSIDFIAATTSGQFITKNGKHLFVVGVGIGYIAYQQKLEANGVTGTIDGGSVGFSLDAAYDLKIAKKIAIGPRISYIGGSIGKFTTSAGETFTTEDDQKENLSRLDFSLGFRLYL